jgi:hypothetical protein
MLTIFLLILTNLHPFLCSKEPFHIVKAESQRFSGGTVMSPSGVNYTIVLSSNKKLKNISISEVWVGNKKFEEISVNSNNDTQIPISLTKGVLIYIHFTHWHIPKEASQMEDEVNKDDSIRTQPSPPVKYSGAALVVMKINKKTSYLEIPQFSRVEPQLRP